MVMVREKLTPESADWRESLSQKVQRLAIGRGITSEAATPAHVPRASSVQGHSVPSSLAPRSPGGQFMPGTSGNPGGRPRDPDYANVITLARQHTAEAVEVLVEIMRDTNRSEYARLAAANAILDRGWGRPAQLAAIVGSNAGQQVVIHVGGVDGRL